MKAAFADRTLTLGFIVLAIQATGCAADLTAGGSRVRVGREPPAAQCRELGLVYGSAGGGAYTTNEYKMEGAQNELRNKAAEMGGDYVVMDLTGAGSGSFTVSGRAFACGGRPLPAMVPAATAPPSAEERILKLRDLLNKGLITKEEFDRRRQEIVNSL